MKRPTWFWPIYRFAKNDVMYCHFFLDKETRLLSKRYSASYNFRWIGCIGHLIEQTHTVDFEWSYLWWHYLYARDLLRQLPQDNLYSCGTIVSKRAWYRYSWFLNAGRGEEWQHLLILQKVSSLLLTYFHQAKPSGFIGFDSVKKRNWSALDIENLHMLADILSIAIERGEVQGL